MTADAPWDPELAAKLVLAGITTRDASIADALAPLIEGTAKMLKSVADRIEKEDSEAKQELMSRCRWLVESRGTVRAPVYGKGRRPNKAYHRYTDQRLEITWEYPIGGPPWAEDDSMPVMNVQAPDGDHIGSQIGTSTATCALYGLSLHDLLAYVRQLMVLDDIARHV